MNYLSTTLLAKHLNIDREDLVAYLLKRNLMQVHEGVWTLTEAGERLGAKYGIANDGRRYVQWPEAVSVRGEDLAAVLTNQDQPGVWLTATRIGHHFNLDATKVNSLLSEIGWIEHDQTNGWRTTQSGKQLGAVEREYQPTGHYVVWPETILQNRILTQVCQLERAQFEAEAKAKSEARDQERIDKFRQDLPGTYRTKDGHWVRSRAEVIIDNMLYDYGLVHAYERKVPIEEELYSDFYLPDGKIYLEYWGMEDDPKYMERKNAKLAIYKNTVFAWLS